MDYLVIAESLSYKAKNTNERSHLIITNRFETKAAALEVANHMAKDSNVKALFNGEEYKRYENGESVEFYSTQPGQSMTIDVVGEGDVFNRIISAVEHTPCGFMFINTDVWVKDAAGNIYQPSSIERHVYKYENGDEEASFVVYMRVSDESESSEIYCFNLDEVGDDYLGIIFKLLK